MNLLRIIGLKILLAIFVSIYASPTARIFCPFSSQFNCTESTDDPELNICGFNGFTAQVFPNECNMLMQNLCFNQRKKIVNLIGHEKSISFSLLDFQRTDNSDCEMIV